MQLVIPGPEPGSVHWAWYRVEKMRGFVSFPVSGGIDLINEGRVVAMELAGTNAYNWS